jgi:hypothetical protein
MRKEKKFIVRISILTVGFVALLIGVAVGASGPIVEPDAVIIHSFDGEQLGDGFGWVGADLGDINGDDIHDLLIPAPFYIDANGFVAGKVYIYSGDDGSLLNSVVGNGAAWLGYSAATAGDVNGDDVPDYILGAPVGSYAEVYSGADHTLLLTLNGVGGDFFGSAVSGAGDVNDDGYDDLIVGARLADDSFTNAGRAYLFSGQDGSLLWTQDGQGQNHIFGSAAGLVGDVNGDGVPDQVVGAVGAGPASGGEAYVLSGANGDIIYTLEPKDPANAVVFGVFFASGAGDYNRDGVPDIFVADYAATVNGVAGTGNAFVYSGADGRLLLALNGLEPGGGFGPGRAMDDIDGDGFGDLVIGSWTSNRGTPAGGKVAVISGRGPRPARVVQTMTGNVAGDNLGVDALPVGDLNGDGLIDFMGTAVGNNFNGTDVGHVFIIAGSYRHR